jgi:hypothetical protein
MQQTFYYGNKNAKEKKSKRIICERRIATKYKAQAIIRIRIKLDFLSI